MAELWRPGQSDPLAPPGFRPLPVMTGDYMHMHPTRYGWEAHVIPLIRKLYRQMGGPDEIHINTYYDHPPDEQSPRRWPLDFYSRLSLDVWGGGGRNDPIGKAKGQKAFDIIWNDQNRPYIDWIIWQRKMYWRDSGVWPEPQPYGKNPFSWHQNHVHATFQPADWTP